MQLINSRFAEASTGGFSETCIGRPEADGRCIADAPAPGARREARTRTNLSPKVS